MKEKLSKIQIIEAVNRMAANYGPDLSAAARKLMRKTIDERLKEQDLPDGPRRSAA